MFREGAHRGGGPAAGREGGGILEDDNALAEVLD